MGTSPEQQAGCCTGYPLNFQHTLATPQRHACQFRGHPPPTRSAAHTCPHKPLCIVHDFQSGSGAPWHLVPSLQASGAFAEDPDKAGGVVTVEDGAPAPTPRRRRHSVDIHGWRTQTQMRLNVHGGKVQPRPATYRGEASHTHSAPSRARPRMGAVDHDDIHTVAHVIANVGHARWEAAELTHVSHT